jgi:hypothetical protein
MAQRFMITATLIAWVVLVGALIGAWVGSIVGGAWDRYQAGD